MVILKFMTKRVMTTTASVSANLLPRQLRAPMDPFTVVFLLKNVKLVDLPLPKGTKASLGQFGSPNLSGMNSSGSFQYRAKCEPLDERYPDGSYESYDYNEVHRCEAIT